MTLRRKLVAVQLAVVAAGLAVFGVASYLLYQRAEQRTERADLVAQVAPLSRELCLAVGDCGPPVGPGARGSGPPPGIATTPAGAARAPTTGCGSTVDARFVDPLPGSFAELRSASGKVLATLRVPSAAAGFAAARCPEPDLPRHLPTGRFLQVRSTRRVAGPFLVYSGPATPGRAGRPGTRRLAGDEVVVAIPVGSLAGSLASLRVLELSVGAVLLVVLAAVTLLLVGRSLRPLERMVGTAGAIGSGELSARVPEGDERSEVGQLGMALNAMLASIEAAFAERAATESRLRQFLADASHELRTPLTSIRGYAELGRLGSGRPVPAATPARAGGDPPGPPIDPAVALARIEEHARSMSELVDELLLLARLDQTPPAERRPVDLAVVAAEACDDLAALDPTRGVTLDAPEPVVVAGDPTHLRRAVTNLTTNAACHTPAGTPVSVRVRAEGTVASLSVEDRGPGLAVEDLDHAFDRFWQADAARSSGGTGLGLAVVAAVAAEHEGDATAANRAGGGAVFTLRIPLAD